ncbi:MAG TPA: RNA-guided pseudouridylation complex pseudouridine synthase subunit Cbf5 [Candidatus Poseidoniales archaeon]|nr:MAG TPA: RNA-guided pseudouridylation complex pseudouridine synthase subunit Cbf5 [Candidatus Poseidoniales archaeon]HII86923.1 RNA-guided pseudouridylation complex pseudouridine synthase subunit Cbf5 [Candidatus Poseidoniaceae archaeon]
MTYHVLDTKATTNPAVGTMPDQRTVEQRLAGGFILLDKPAGPTSHQVAAWARDLFELERLGHGGTLDPFATGVLPLMAGKAMKVTKKILNHKKSYICVFRFAQEVSDEDLQEAMVRLTGRVYNVPPEVSAVKVQVRTRKIFAFEQLDRSGNDMIARVHCEAGTYIRTMARDIGLLLNMKVQLKELRRDMSGVFTLDDCVTLQELADAVWLWKECDRPEALIRIIHPIEKLLLDLPSATVKDSAAAALAHGAPLLRPGLVNIAAGVASGKEIYVQTLKNEAVGVVTLTADTDDIASMTEGEVARPSMVLMDGDVYPRRWKSPE